MNQTAPQTIPYGAWPSPLTIQKLIEYAPNRIGQLASNQHNVFWVESRSAEGGRQVVVRYDEGVTETLTPKTFSIRTRVHEYGGKALHVANDKLWFVNDKDQNLYEQSLVDPQQVKRITQSDSQERFADPIWVPGLNQLVCIRERHGIAKEPINDIVAINLDSSETTIVHEGHDFYAHARVSPNEERIAFLAWDHPNMPWNGTQLYIQEFNSEHPKSHIIAGGDSESIVQPEWLSNDTLVYSSDHSGSYDLYAFNESGTFEIAADGDEYGHAMWQLGSQSYLLLNEKHILAAPGSARLVLIDSSNGLQTPIDEPGCSLSGLTQFKEGIAFVASFKTKPAEIRFKPTFADESKPIHTHGDFPIDKSFISSAETITFVGSQGDDVHAYLYLPVNPNCVAPKSERPPLLVLAHGGPTASTSKSLSASVQFFTTRGWAVLDVNYSGSTGYGRAYRDRLLNEWGNRDVEDLSAGVRHLIGQDLIDPARVAIAGGSAGGYTVLRALTTSSTFKAGACRYGIGDLRILANDTHKFESRYVDQLVPEDELDDRSPIHHIESLNCPVIFTQGLEDKIVPPNQAKMMFKALQDNQIPTALFLFEGEQHGFRKLDTQVKVASAEYWFFSRVFNFEPHGIDASALDGGELANMDQF